TPARQYFSPVTGHRSRLFLLRRLRRLEGDDVRLRLALGDAAAARLEEAGPGDPVFLRVGVAHLVDERGVGGRLRLAQDVRTVVGADPDVERAAGGDALRLPRIRRGGEEELAVAAVVEPDRRR